MNMNQPVYKRILLKISGEALMGERGYGIDPNVLNRLADEIKEVHELGVQVGVVIGGGNIYRGVDAVAEGIDKVVGDQMGMLATVINALALQNVLEKKEL
jgi:uridylate kinase